MPSAPDDQLRQLLNLGRGFFEKRQFPEAERYLSQVVERSQSFADVYNMLGTIYHDQGQYARAQRAFEAALRINPAYTEASLNLAVIYNDMGKYAEARRVYDAALKRSSKTPGALDPFVKGKIANMYAEIGDVLVASAHFKQAIGEYRRALALCPTFVDLRLKLAGALRDEGDRDAAIRELQGCIRTHPSFVPARVALGVALYGAGKTKAAEKAWREVLGLSPGHRVAEMYLTLVRAPGVGEAPAN
jgi:tetratricopeptide (TPR) repeat protein